MGLSTCKFCGAEIQHGDDGAEYNAHMLNCPRLKASAEGPTGSTQTDLDALWADLQAAAALPGAAALPAAVGGLMKQTLEKVLHPLLTFDGAIQDYLALPEDIPMQNFLKILAMIPSIIGIVKQSEDTIVGPKMGPHRLNMVLDTVNAAVSAVPEVQQSLASHDLNGTVTAIVGGVVNAMNAAKGQPAPPAPPVQEVKAGA